ncbi:MAG: hypothetical protein QOE59_2518 [Actinomycetota bacterium]|jgi:hypothetical protein|nr:hypothetical protein [Actinomycetota bacterium]
MRAKTVLVVGLVTAAVGTLLEYLTGVPGFPTVPPGPIILAVAVVLVVLVVLAALVQVLGLAAALVGGVVALVASPVPARP